MIVDERMVQAAGKLQLLDRILPVLKSRQHKVCVVFIMCCSVLNINVFLRFQVLIFCQMTIMLDLLEDYLDYRHYQSERIDGTVPWRERQVFLDELPNAPFSHARWELSSWDISCAPVNSMVRKNMMPCCRRGWTGTTLVRKALCSCCQLVLEA